MEKLGKPRTRVFEETKKKDVNSSLTFSREQENPENSILYEQGHDREKFSYRK